MDNAKSEENRIAYDQFLTQLNKTMHEALAMAVNPSEDDEPQATPADGMSGE
jgi:hypothetical protein